MPPSFSFAATFGSFKQQALEMMDLRSDENRRISVQLPQFPGYNTFNSQAQAPSQSNDSLLDTGHLNQSYGSLNTDHTGRSLDTIDVLSCNSIAAVDNNSVHGDNQDSIANTEDCSTQVTVTVKAAVSGNGCQTENNTTADFDFIDNELESAEASSCANVNE